MNCYFIYLGGLGTLSFNFFSLYALLSLRDLRPYNQEYEKLCVKKNYFINKK